MSFVLFLIFVFLTLCATSDTRGRKVEPSQGALVVFCTVVDVPLDYLREHFDDFAHIFLKGLQDPTAADRLPERIRQHSPHLAVTRARRGEGGHRRSIFYEFLCKKHILISMQETYFMNFYARNIFYEFLCKKHILISMQETYFMNFYASNIFYEFLCKKQPRPSCCSVVALVFADDVDAIAVIVLCDVFFTVLYVGKNFRVFVAPALVPNVSIPSTDVTTAPSLFCLYCLFLKQKSSPHETPRLLLFGSPHAHAMTVT
eukprot:284818901_3